MKVLYIGGTGQIGFETVRLLCERGDQVTALVRGELPKKHMIPKQLKLVEENYRTISVEQWASYFTGCDALMLAVGLNENYLGAIPIDQVLIKKDIIPLRRLMSIAHRCGVKRVVLAGSYLAYFNRVRKDIGLAEQPFVKSCVEQENIAITFADGMMEVSVLEFPWIVGGAQWSVPLLMPMVAEAMNTEKKYSVVTRGGISLITARQAAQAMLGALDHGRGGRAYPIGFYDMTWADIMKMIHSTLGLPDKKIKVAGAVALPSLAKKEVSRIQAENKVGVLNAVEMLPLRTSEAYLDKHIAVDKFGVAEDNLQAALEETVKHCADLLARASRSEKPGS